MQVKGFRYTGIIVFLLSVTAPCIIWGISVPDTITLNTQSKLYEPFSFNHAEHIQVDERMLLLPPSYHRNAGSEFQLHQVPS